MVLIQYADAIREGNPHTIGVASQAATAYSKSRTIMVYLTDKFCIAPRIASQCGHLYNAAFPMLKT